MKISKLTLEKALIIMAGDIKKSVQLVRLFNAATTYHQITRMEKIMSAWVTRLSLERDWLQLHSDN